MIVGQDDAGLVDDEARAQTHLRLAPAGGIAHAEAFAEVLREGIFMRNPGMTFMLWMVTTEAFTRSTRGATEAPMSVGAGTDWADVKTIATANERDASVIAPILQRRKRRARPALVRPETGAGAGTGHDHGHDLRRLARNCG